MAATPMENFLADLRTAGDLLAKPDATAVDRVNAGKALKRAGSRNPYALLRRTYDGGPAYG
jgi:hypothetical protein